MLHHCTLLSLFDLKNNLSREGQHVTFVHMVHDRCLLLDFVRAIRLLPLNRTQVADAVNSVVRILEEYSRSIGVIKAGEVAKTPIAIVSAPATADVAPAGGPTTAESVNTTPAAAVEETLDASVAEQEQRGADVNVAPVEVMDVTNAVDHEHNVVVNDMPEGDETLHDAVPLEEAFEYDGNYRNEYGDTEEDEEEAAYDEDETMAPVAHGQNSSSSSSSGDDDDQDAERREAPRHAFVNFNEGDNQVEIELDVVDGQMANADLAREQHRNVINNILDEIAENDAAEDNDSEASEDDEMEDDDGQGEDTEDEVAGENDVAVSNEAPVRAYAGGENRVQVRNVFDLNMHVPPHDEFVVRDDTFAVNNGLLRV